MPVDILSPVSMVAISVNNGDLLDPIVPSDIFDHDRLVVDIAKSPVAVNDSPGVVTRRAHKGKGALYLSIKDRISSNKASARRDQMALCGDGSLVRHTEVDTPEVFVGCGTDTVFDNPINIEKALLQDLVLGIKEAFLPLRR